MRFEIHFEDFWLFVCMHGWGKLSFDGRFHWGRLTEVSL